MTAVGGGGGLRDLGDGLSEPGPCLNSQKYISMFSVYSDVRNILYVNI